MKPYKGEIRNWKIVEFADARDKTVIGVPIGHPLFVGWIRTSQIINMEDRGGYWDVETMNSRYKLYYSEKANDDE
jgi:hypothetical protein